MNSVMKVNFHGAVLYGSRIDEIVYVALKPIVEAMGLEWSAQLKRVRRDPVFSEGMAMMAIPSEGGAQETVGLSLNLLPGWLVTVDSLRVKSAEIRAKVILYQRECYDVLAKHFLGKRTASDSATVAHESLSVRMAHEARLLFGKRAGAEVWFARGLPHTPSMTAPPDQTDLFSWSKRVKRKQRYLDGSAKRKLSLAAAQD